MLQFRGGVIGLLAPFVLLFVGILWLGLRGVAIPEALWPIVLLALFLGLLLARSQQLFLDAVITGIASPMLAIMLLAWFLAGIVGALLSRTGVIEGLVWITVAAGVPVAWLPLAAFLIAAGMSLATGTSIGTILAATPVLFPSAIALGADPLLVLGAIIGGAFVGDNLAPISDTTTVSAYTQDTKVNRVVRNSAGARAACHLCFAVCRLVRTEDRAHRADSAERRVSPRLRRARRAALRLVVPCAADEHRGREARALWRHLRGRCAQDGDHQRGPADWNRSARRHAGSRQKHADIVLFDRHPFDSLARVERTYIDGELVYERSRNAAWLTTQY